MTTLPDVELRRRADFLLDECGMSIDYFHALLTVPPCPECGYDKQYDSGVCVWCGKIRGRAEE